MKTASQRDEFRSLLHPVDPLDVPVPGFPSHDALVAWARTKDRSIIESAALEVLRDDEWAQQYAAMGVLRALGWTVEGEGHGEAFRWTVHRGGEPTVIEPRHKPVVPGEPSLSPVSRANKAFFDAVNQLDATARDVLYLRLVDGFSPAEIAQALGVGPRKVEVVLKDVLRALRELMDEDETSSSAASPPRSSGAA